MIKPKSQGNIFDAFAKQMFSKVAVFADPKFVAEIDLTKIKPVPTHYVGKEGDERIADLVFQCPLKNGSGIMMAVIVFEHQSGSLKRIPMKLHKYISAIWDAEMKEGKKVLSAPYFIVLRTGKKPMRRKPPTMSDWLPKGQDGKVIGKTVEIDYDVVDLPAWDFNRLPGNAVLRLALGILYKMTGGKDDEFPEALMPLRELDNDEQQIEWSKDLLIFVAKVFRAHGRELKLPIVSDTLDRVFSEKEKEMKLTIFEEMEAKGEARGGIRAVLAVLRARFKKVPKDVEKAINAMTDPVALDSWAEHAATCSSMQDFAKALK